jgi:hypothetical protein
MMKYFNWRYLVIGPLAVIAFIGLFIAAAGSLPGLLMAFLFGAPCLTLWDYWQRRGEFPSGEIHDKWEEIDED